MTTEQFVNKYNGKGIDFDGQFGNQCMDLAAKFVQEVWGHSGWDIARGFAYQVWTQFDSLPVSKYAHRVPNTPTGVPPEGALMVWGQGIGSAGHISVVRGGSNTNVFQSFDQNWNGHQYCEPVLHSYNHIYGWIVLNQATQPKGDIMDTSTGGELYLTALHRPAENAGSAGQWNGQPARDALIKLRSEPEWQTVDTKVRMFDALNAKVTELSKNPTKAELEAVVNQLKQAQSEVETLKAKTPDDKAAEVVAEKIGSLAKFVALVAKFVKGGK
jgi:hypothetical protein